jgi:hypothetical protein
LKRPPATAARVIGRGASAIGKVTSKLPASSPVPVWTLLSLHAEVGAVADAARGVAEVEVEHLVVVGEAEDRSVAQVEPEQPAQIVRAALSGGC